MRYALLFLTLATGCTLEAPTRSGSGNSGGNAATRAPANALRARVGANLANQVEIVGVAVEPAQITPGVPAKVTVFFKALAPIPADWTVFVHLEDAEGQAERTNVDHAPAGGGYNTSQWKVGETVRDEFAIYVPPGSPPKALNVLIGLWDPKTDQRMKLMNPDQVRNDGKDRILLAQVPVASL